MTNHPTILTLVLTASPLVALTQEAPGGSLKTLQAVRTDVLITIDGLLDEADWANAAVIEDVHQIIPVEYAEPSQRTRFLVLYDNEALYLAAIMHDDEPDRVTANVLRQGGQSWRDDQFNIFLDPFTSDKMGLNDFFQYFGRARVVPGALWIDDGDWSLVANAKAIGLGTKYTAIFNQPQLL